MKAKRIMIPMAALTLIAVVALGSAKSVSAQSSDIGHPLVSRIAERFGLDEAEVQETFMEFKALEMSEKHEKMEEHFNDRLEEAVEAGKLTEAQQFAIIEKHEEIENRRDELEDLSREDRREAMTDLHEEMESWAEENGIDMESIIKFENKYMDGTGQRGMKKMH